MSACAIETPIGPLSLQADESAVSAMRFGAGGALPAMPAGWRSSGSCWRLRESTF